jgi:ribose transport system ATP-binding protein
MSAGEGSPEQVPSPASPSDEIVLRVREARKTFGGLKALDGVSFDLRRGEIHAIVGENGAGKSTLIKVITGAHRPDSGSIEIDEHTYDGLSAEEARHMGIAVVYQEFSLLPDLSVGENIFLGMQPRGRFGLLDLRRRRQLAGELLDRLGADIDPSRPVRTLTVGERQIVEVAKALAVKARILIMDEPSAVLPTHDLDRLFTIIRTLRDHGASVIYISHRLAEIFNLADRVTVLKDGHSVATRPVKGTSRAALIEMMVGRPLSDQFPSRTGQHGEPILQVRNLCVESCVWNVNFDVHEGEILGLAGLGGSGRTTIAQALVGLAHVESGEILYKGEPAPGNPSNAASKGLVLVPEDRAKYGLSLDKPIGFNVALPWLSKLKRLRMFLSTALERRLVGRSIAAFQVRPPNSRLVVEALSGGNQQKVVLAKWLAMQPQALILDEPTRGIDVSVREEIYLQMRQLAANGVAIVMASSDLPEILGMSDRIIVLHEGKVAGELDCEQATEEGVMRLATGEIRPVATQDPRLSNDKLAEVS